MAQNKGPVGNPVRAFLLTPLIAYLFFSTVFAIFASQFGQVTYYLIIFFPAAIFSFLIMLIFGVPLFLLVRQRGWITPLLTVGTASTFSVFLFVLFVIRSETFLGGWGLDQCLLDGMARSCDFGLLAKIAGIMALVGAFYGVIFWFLYRPQQSTGA
jgi:hypothetical protein